MSTLKAAYKSELFKISKKKKLIVAAILAIAAVAVAGFIIMSVNNLAGIKITGRSEFAIRILPFFNLTLIPLFTAFVCIDMFSGEFAGDTIKLTLTRPASRFKIFLSKVLAAATFIISNLIFTMLAAIVMSVAAGQFGMNLKNIMLSYLLSFFPLFTFSLMVVFISNFARGSASAFLITTVIYLLLFGLEFVIPAYKSFLYTSSFDWYKLFIGSYINFQKIIRVFFIFTGYDIMFFTLGYCLFEKRSI